MSRYYLEPNDNVTGTQASITTTQFNSNPRAWRGPHVSLDPATILMFQDPAMCLQLVGPVVVQCATSTTGVCVTAVGHQRLAASHNTAIPPVLTLLSLQLYLSETNTFRGQFVCALRCLDNS